MERRNSIGRYTKVLFMCSVLLNWGCEQNDSLNVDEDLSTEIVDQPGSAIGRNGWYLFSGGKGFGAKVNNSDKQAKDLYVADVNGDFKDDVIFANRSSFESQLSYAPVVSYGASTTPQQQGAGYIRNPNWIFGDVNDDGNEDLFYEHIHFYMKLGDDWRTLPGAKHFDFSSTADNYKGGDFNGDNKMDIMVTVKGFSTRPSGWYISDNCQSEWKLKKAFTEPVLMKDALIGDFNGDGKDDVFVSIQDNDSSSVGTSSEGWYVSYSGTGKSSKNK